MNIDNTLLQKYAPALLSALVLVVPAVDVLAKNPTPIAVLQFLALVVTTATTFQLRSPWKQTAEWVGVGVAAVLPLAITGEVTWANWALVAVAVVKAAAAHLGVAIRKDDTLDARTAAPGVPAIITSLPAAAMPVSDAIVVGDGLSDPGNTSIPEPDVPRHLARAGD
ncbi:hypothetical protein [Curtobacterium sp. ISL-83]|uniref:hypothetical protein n=1 Tax=Curtobacterium sp. ISL-83 TaxID=2819145 RepID=UPI001BE512B3|nr:hypothetical protein [Curtobacterium sp. ISL-83]MBT2502968.1 hypothetical protein [Curtobacterium sp. ISL-83]